MTDQESKELAQKILDKQAWNFTLIDAKLDKEITLQATVTDMKVLHDWLNPEIAVSIECYHPEFYGWDVDELVEQYERAELAAMLSWAENPNKNPKA